MSLVRFQLAPQPKYLREISSVGLEHYLDKVGVTGSNPVFPTSQRQSSLLLFLDRLPSNTIGLPNISTLSPILTQVFLYLLLLLDKETWSYEAKEQKRQRPTTWNRTDICRWNFIFKSDFHFFLAILMAI